MSHWILEMAVETGPTCPCVHPAASRKESSRAHVLGARLQLSSFFFPLLKRENVRQLPEAKRVGFSVRNREAFCSSICKPSLHSRRKGWECWVHTNTCTYVCMRVCMCVCAAARTCVCVHFHVPVQQHQNYTRGKLLLLDLFQLVHKPS